MKFSKKILSQTITQLCLAKDIDRVVISPGSRNAPLTIGFTEHSEFTNYSIVDERCAAFFALGLAQQLDKPVALVCTSGSALLNYYPAIAEAFYSNIPLVIISADRPYDLIEIGDGQTIKQENVFANHILYSANCKEGESFQKFNEAEINKALNVAIATRGPVHINAPFSEPLYEKVEELAFRPANIPLVVSSEENLENLDEFRKIWNSSKRKMILIGVLPPNSIEQRLLDRLAKDDSVIVLTETTSNLHHPDFFTSIDQLIAPLDTKGFEALQPEVLLTFGGMVISKKIKSFLREFAPKHHWHVDTKRAYDTYFKLDHHFKTSATLFIVQFFAETQSISSDYKTKWLTVDGHRSKLHQKYVDEVGYSDFKVFSMVLNSIPHGYQLQLGNSTTVRYAQLFKLDSSLQVFCNRGTSGIDGSTSTAIGAAVAFKEPTIFITGDLSFFYDSNALWNNYTPNDFRIIIVNNGGGGIFRILPGAKNTEHFNTYFETRHELSAKQLCEMYSFEYASANNETELINEVNSFYQKSSSPKLLEIFTPPEINDKILLDYFEFIR